MDLVRIQQTRSPIRRHHNQRRTLIGLGLNKIGRIAEVPFTSSTWGMIHKVWHLVRFPDEDLFGEHRLVRPQPVDEVADKELMRQLVFNPHQILLEPFTQEEMRGRKTPDFKLIKAGTLVGYCELKSPRDDWIFDVPADLKRGELREEVRQDSTAHNLARNIGKAAEQFEAAGMGVPGAKRRRRRGAPGSRPTPPQRAAIFAGAEHPGPPDGGSCGAVGAATGAWGLLCPGSGVIAPPRQSWA
jgi:ribosomal protein L30